MTEFEALSAIPLVVTSGDKLPIALRELSANYPPANFSIVFNARLGGANAVTVTLTDVGGLHSGALDFSSAAAGVWAYSLVATDGSNQVATVDRGFITVNPNPASGDSRSHAEKTLEAILAVIENRASKDQESYSIAGRTLNRTPLDDLLKLKSHYTAIVASERRRAAGLSPTKKTLARFI